MAFVGVTEPEPVYDDDDEVLTPIEAAEILKLHTKTLIKLATRGDIPSMRVGRQWRFRRAELLARILRPQ